MLLYDHAGLSDDARTRWRAILTGHTTLERVVRWGYAQQPPVDITDVLVQDEFTHDVIAPAGDVVLVYDTT